jgi:ABC-2 type transport system permease protein
VTAPRRRLRALLTLTYLNGVLPIRTQPLYLINVVASPLSFLFFITIASNGTLLADGLGGGMLMTMLSIGTSLQTDVSHYRQDLKLQDMVVASPVEAPTYVAGLALSELVYSLPGLSVFVILWAYYGWASPVGALSIGLVLLLVWAFASALGFTLATFLQDVRETFIFSGIISLALSVLPPVYYPIQRLPGWLQPFAYASPTTYAADLLHRAFGQQALPGVSPAVDWFVLIAFTIGLLALAGWKARWREP